jgi:acetyl/propionyl-CoA carboxylase alpha subunit
VKGFFPHGKLWENGDWEGGNKLEQEFVVDNELVKIFIEEKGDKYIIGIDDKEYKADIQALSPSIVSINIKDQIYRVIIKRGKDGFYVHCRGDQYLIQDIDQDAGGIQSDEEKSREDMLKVKATMPGKVIKIQVSEKEEVRVGQTLAIVEAMKMENEIKSSMDGIVKKIFAFAGDLVDSDKPIMELEERKE